MKNKVIYVASDHAGFDLKKKMIPVISSWGYSVVDCGCDSADKPVYFPLIAKKLCTPILEGKAYRGIMFCGTGVGASIACNKIPGIRASMIHDVHCAHQAVEHDDVQVMCIGEKIVGEWLAPDLIKTFLEAKANKDDWTPKIVELLNDMDGYSEQK